MKLQKIKKYLLVPIAAIVVSQLALSAIAQVVPDTYDDDNTTYGNAVDVANFKFDRPQLYVEVIRNDSETDYTYKKGAGYTTRYDNRIMTFTSGSSRLTMDVCKMTRAWISSNDDEIYQKPTRFFFPEISDTAEVNYNLQEGREWAESHQAALTTYHRQVLSSADIYNERCLNNDTTYKDLTPLPNRKVDIKVDLNGGDSGDGEDTVMAEHELSAELLLENLYLCLWRDGQEVLMYDHSTRACGKISGVTVRNILDDDDNTQKNVSISTPGARTGSYEVSILGLGRTRTQAESVNFGSTGDGNRKHYGAAKDDDLDIDFAHVLREARTSPDSFLERVEEHEEAVRLANLEDELINTGDGPTGSQSADVIGCETGSGPLGWIICPIINGLVSAVDWVRISVIEPSLEVSPLQTGTSDATYSVWVQIRNVAFALLVPLFLVMIMSQALSFEVFDAYTVKRALPRIVVATIGISLSYYFCALLIDFFNVLGAGLDNLVLNAVAQAGGITITADSIAASGFVNVAAILGTTGTIWYLTSSIGASIGLFMLMVLLPLVLGVLTVFITLVARQAVILLLVMLSPLAFLAYIFPSTEGYFKTWYSIFSKTLLMYPLIILLLMSGGLFAAIITTASNSPLAQITAIVAVAAPMFLIPATFKMAGAAMGAVGGALTGMSGRIKAPLTDRRNPNSAYNKLKGKQQVGQQRQAIRFMRNNVNNKGIRGRAAKTMARWGPNLDMAEGRFNEEAGKQIEDLVNNGKDGYAYALLGLDHDPRNGKPLEADAIEYAKRNHGNTHLTQAALSYAMRKAGETGQLTKVKDDLIGLGHRVGMQNSEIDGAWIGAAFKNQMTQGQLKHQTARPDQEVNQILQRRAGSGPYDSSSTGVAAYGVGKADEFAQEALETKGSYAFAQQREGYWKGLVNAEQRVQMHRDLLDSGDAEYMSKMGIKSEAERTAGVASADSTLEKFTTLKDGLASELASSPGGITGTADEDGMMYTKSGAPILAGAAMRDFVGTERLDAARGSTGRGPRTPPGGTPPPTLPPEPPAPGAPYSYGS